MKERLRFYFAYATRRANADNVEEVVNYFVMSIDEKQVKQLIRERLAVIGKKNPRLAISGYLFRPDLLAEIRAQVIQELAGQPPSKSLDTESVESEIRMYRKRRWIDSIRSYGIPFEEYLKLVRSQKNCCAICFKTAIAEKASSGRRLCIDHDHETGMVRGLLCNSCNIRLGIAKRLTSIDKSYLASPPAPRLLGKTYYGKPD